MKKLVLSATILALAVSLASPALAASRGGSVKVQHSETTKDVAGQVTAVNMGKSDIVVSGTTFNVPRSAKVTINGAMGMMVQIKVGDQAGVSYTIRTTTTVRSGSRGRGGSRSSKRHNDGKDGTAIIADSVTVTR